MNALASLLGRRRLILTLAGLMAASGMILWLVMVRQEDPRLPDFWGQVVAPFPGADAETVERLVLDPMEDALAEVSEIELVEATAFDEVAVIVIELRGDTRDFTAAWEEVRQALRRARRDFPEGAGEPILDEDQQDQDSVVLAVTGSADSLALLEGARLLRDELLALPQVARVTFVADQGEQVTVAVDDAAARRLGTSAVELQAQLAARNRVLPGGSLSLGGKTVRLNPLADFESLDEIARTPVPLPGGSFVPLGEMARVHLGPEEPARARMRINGELAVGLAVVPRSGINLVSFGESVREELSRVKAEIEPLSVQEVTFQPERTASRLQELNRSLLFSILIVAGVLVLAMGPRLGLVVASVVPLVTLSALVVFAWGGGVLHQISIAALVLALGMLVDNAIVVAENIQWRLDRGAGARDASVAAVRELARPLAGATLTTLAAFVPMVIASGPTAEFTRTIPIVLMLTLSVSYLYAVSVTPILSELVLRRSPSTRTAALDGYGRRLAGTAVERPLRVLLVAAVAVALSLLAASRVDRQFFPSSDRNQFVVDLKLPEGAHLDATDEASRAIERWLMAREDVSAVSSYMGRSAPKFYYNIRAVPFSPHFAQLIVETDVTGSVDRVIGDLRKWAPTAITQAEMVARKLEQGPPVNAPVEIRLTGHDLEALEQTASAVIHELRKIPGTQDVRHDLGPGAPTLRFHVDDAAAARFGISRADVALALYGRTRGLPMGELRTGKDPIPVVLRSSRGERTPADELDGIDVMAKDGRLIPLGQLARVDADWRPAAMKHWNGERVVTVSSQLAPGFTFSSVLQELRPKLETLDLPANVEIGLGGDAEGSGEANTALLRAFPIGLLILLGVLLAEFNSFRRMTIILVTVPLAAAGVVPGLLIAGQPFGFMSLLGVVALVGIVVNNAIVLVEAVEDRRGDGATVKKALEDAVARRIRPILLTSATTVAGLLPLALSPSTLWPPLAWAMISGLLASTLLTLAVVPALYWLLFRDSGSLPSLAPATVTVAAILIPFLMAAPALEAEEPLELTLGEAMSLGMKRPAADVSELTARAADAAAKAELRSAVLPSLVAEAGFTQRDRLLALVTPIGEFPFGDRRQGSVAVQVVQPLLDPAGLFYAAPAARKEAEAAYLEAARASQLLAAEAAGAVLDLLVIDARIAATLEYEESIAARLRDSEARVTTGRSLEADALKVRLALEEARQELLSLRESRLVAGANLAIAVGRDGDVEALPIPDSLTSQGPTREEAVARSQELRTDLAALEVRREALEKRRRGVGAELFPRLDARGIWTWVDGSPYDEDSWWEGGLTLSWNPLAAGTRPARRAALEAQEGAMEARLVEARRGVELEVNAALARMASARGALGVGERGVEQASETLRVERERHRVGRVTVNDLLEAEAALYQRTLLRDLARLEVARSWVHLWLAMGGTELPPGV